MTVAMRTKSTPRRRADFSPGHGKPLSIDQGCARRIGRFGPEGNPSVRAAAFAGRRAAPATFWTRLSACAGKPCAGRDKGGQRRPERRPLVADSEHDGLARLGGYGERAERPVPDGERKAEVLVEMDGIGGVMQLVMRRALQDAAGDAGERDPHMAVPQMPVGQEEHHREDVAVEQA